MLDNFIRRTGVIIVSKMRFITSGRRTSETRDAGLGVKRSVVRELIQAISSSWRQTNGIEQFVFARRLSSGYYLARVSRVSRIKSADEAKREGKKYIRRRGNYTKNEKERKRDDGDDDRRDSEGENVRRGRGAKQHGDEATKSIILLNNKPCYVRFAKITKTTLRFVPLAYTPVRFIHPRLAVARSWHFHSSFRSRSFRLVEKLSRLSAAKRLFRFATEIRSSINVAIIVTHNQFACAISQRKLMNEFVLIFEKSRAKEDIFATNLYIRYIDLSSTYKISRRKHFARSR